MPEKMTVMGTGEAIGRDRRPADGPATVGFAPYPAAGRRATLPSVSYLRTLAFHLSALVLGPVWFAVLVVGWATGLGLVVTLLGLPVIWLTLVVARELIAFEIRLARDLLGAEVAAPPRRQGWALRERAADPGVWRGQLYLLLRFMLGLVYATVLLSCWAAALGLVVAPLWYWALPDGIQLGLFDVDTLWLAFAVIPLGLVVGAVALGLTKLSEVSWRALVERLLPVGLERGDGERLPSLAPRLRHTLVIAAGIETLMLVLWALTGRTSAWPAWTALGLFVPVGIHASLVLAGEVADRRRAGLWRQAGISATAMVVCLGAWVVAGHDYFWPVWPLLGMLIGLGVKALVAYGASSERDVLAPRMEQLTRTRAGAVDARDEELRRIERDLHDGAQARLVAVAMNLGLAEDRLDRDPDGARELVLEAQLQARSAIKELRDLARGIAPPVLADRGLLEAVKALAVTSPLNVSVHGDPGARPGAAVERAAYFVAAEALANASKHARAGHIAITLRRLPDRLVVEVRDDGVGGANPSGPGLAGLRARVEAIDGRLTVESASGAGTMIRASLPCASS
jgi:signal transduction histidine kinase